VRLARIVLVAIVAAFSLSCTLPHKYPMSKETPRSLDSDSVIQVDTVYIRASRTIENVTTAVLWGAIGYATAMLVAR
jgi:hypothetical protein